MSAASCPIIGTGLECVLCRPMRAHQQMVLYPCRDQALELARQLLSRGNAVLRVGKFVRWWAS